MRRSLTTFVLILALLIALVASVSLVHDVFTSRIPGANDFYPRWKGAVLFFREGINPYSTQATELIQTDMYGRLAYPEEDQVGFAYPFYTVFLLAPLAVFDISYAMASAIWLVFLLVAIYLGLIGALRVTSLQMPGWLMLLFFICAIFFYNNVRTLILGQFAGLVFLLLVAMLLALKRGRDALAGICLALATVKPQMSLFLVLALMFWALAQRRIRFVAFFALSLALLVAASFALLPTWSEDFLHQITSYVGYTDIGSPVWILTGFYWPQLGQNIELALSVFILGLLCSLWLRTFRDCHGGEYLLPLAMWTVALAEWILPRTATTNQIILFLPIFWALGRAVRHNVWSHRGVAFFFVSTFAAGWLLFLSTREGRWESPIMYLFMPSLALLMLISDYITVTRVMRAQRVSSDALPG